MATETTAKVVSAPESFSGKVITPNGLDGKVTVYVKGMVIVQTRLGEIILKLPEGMHVPAGQHLVLKPDWKGETAKVLTDRKRPSFQRQGLHGDGVAPVSAGVYRPQTKAGPDLLDSHAVSSEAAVDNILQSHPKEDSFTLARALTLLPDVDPERASTMLLTFLFVSMARGGPAAWLGASKPADTAIWNSFFRETTVDLPGMGKWTVRQFPVTLSRSRRAWGLFAVPEEVQSRVSRFIVEIPTEKLGLVQVKGFGSDATCEIIVNTTMEADDGTISAIAGAVVSTAADIGADVRVKTVCEPQMFVNLSQARRVSLEA